jgi:hypothetical protein
LPVVFHRFRPVRRMRNTAQVSGPNTPHMTVTVVCVLQPTLYTCTVL